MPLLSRVRLDKDKGEIILEKGEPAMPKGFNGKILCVDLTEESLFVKDIDEKTYRTHLGGGLAVEEIFKGVPVGADPLGPDNKLVFFVGPMAGAPISGQSRGFWGAQKPLPGGMGG
jgi:aldehyde:ferredoxin oxidoreductase